MFVVCKSWRKEVRSLTARSCAQFWLGRHAAATPVDEDEEKSTLVHSPFNFIYLFTISP